MKYVCNYSIIRFLPYPETGEFVNIGVVLIANNGDFQFKIELAKHKRVTDFFHTLDRNIYIRARQELSSELSRVQEMMANCDDTSEKISIFNHLTHERETMIRFSRPGTMMLNNATEAAIELFNHYISHSFASKEYEEKNLEKQIGSLLSSSNMKKDYKEERLGTDEYAVRFPFVMRKDSLFLQAIKPLYLGHIEPSRILEHGDSWIARVNRLKAAKRLARDTLFLAAPPRDTSSKQYSAYEEIFEILNHIDGVRVVSSDSTDRQIIKAIEDGMPALH